MELSRDTLLRIQHVFHETGYIGLADTLGAFLVASQEEETFMLLSKAQQNERTLSEVKMMMERVREQRKHAAVAEIANQEGMYD